MTDPDNDAFDIIVTIEPKAFAFITYSAGKFTIKPTDPMKHVGTFVATITLRDKNISPLSTK